MYPRIPDRQLTDDHLFASPYDPDPPKVSYNYAERKIAEWFGPFFNLDEDTEFPAYQAKVLADFKANPERYFEMLAEWPAKWQLDEAIDAIEQFLQHF
jgi:hypothetical protein